MTFRAVIVGCGAMSRGWARALKHMPQVSIAGLVDLDPAAARALAEELGIDGAEISSDLDGLLTRLKPDMLFDIVVPPARREVVSCALAHGCHVLSEKPMADTLHTARELVSLAAKAGRVHAVVQNRRYLAGVRRLRRLVDSGAIGTLTSLHCDFFLGPHFGGFREKMTHPLLLDMAIHTFDVARLVAGRTPRAVYCQETNPAGSWYAAGASANAIFELDDGVTFTYRGSWCASGLPTSWESSWRLIGTEGSATWDGAGELHAEAVTATGGYFSEVAPIDVPELAPEDTVGGHAGIIAEFVSAVAEGRQPETASRDNFKSLAMVFAAIESAEQRRRVPIDTEL